DRGEWLESFRGETAGESYGMLFGNAYVEAAAGKIFFEQVETGAGRHCSRDGDDLAVLARLFDQALGEDLCILWSIGFGLCLSPGRDIEFDHAVILVSGCFGWRVTLSLLGDHVDENRACFSV